MSEEQKETYVDENMYADYEAAMKPVPNDPMAVEWQKDNEDKIIAATKDEVLATYVKDQASGAALLAKIQPAYETNPLTLTVIAAVSQFVMNPANEHVGDGRSYWNSALLAAFRKTKDAYIQTFLLDQLRWCCCATRVAEVKALKSNAASQEVRKYIDWVVSELTGSLIPTK